ncbi:BrnA antitoxin family protein [Treponema sp. OMZ 805]|uniref:BrnA antitoxin family protein n=1 Tax=Treponema sp. OMZ 805 TaxID=2726068 RepID=UPI003D94B485
MRPSHLVNKAMWKPQKKVLSIRVDADLLEALKASGKGWQTRLNNWIRNGINSHYF